MLKLLPTTQALECRGSGQTWVHSSVWTSLEFTVNLREAFCEHTQWVQQQPVPPYPTSSATHCIPSGFMPVVVQMIQGVTSEWSIYQQEVAIDTCSDNFKRCACAYYVFHTAHNILYHCTILAPPTPTGVTAQFTSTSSVRVTWQWTSSGSAPNCFNTTTVTYRPEGGDESSLQLSDPAANETTLTDLHCNTNYTITVVATAGVHRKEGVTFLPLQGIVNKQ